MENSLTEVQRMRGINLLRPLPEQIRREEAVQEMAVGIARVEFPNEVIGQAIFGRWVCERVLAHEEPTTPCIEAS